MGVHRQGGNDYEIFSHPGVIGHSVRSYHDTIDLLRDLLKKLQPVGK
jgi:phosphomannomutase